MTSNFQQGDALPVIKKHITQEQIDRYASASGDFNPIHVDHEFAAEAQFGSTVAHGMLVAASISEMMTVAFGRQWLTNGRLKIRFRAPVFPGESVETTGEVKTIRERNGATEIVCAVAVNKADGDPAITGEAIIAIAASP